MIATSGPNRGEARYVGAMQTHEKREETMQDKNDADLPAHMLLWTVLLVSFYVICIAVGMLAAALALRT